MGKAKQVKTQVEQFSRYEIRELGEFADPSNGEPYLAVVADELKAAQVKGESPLRKEDLDSLLATSWCLRGIPPKGNPYLITHREDFQEICELYVRITGQTIAIPDEPEDLLDLRAY